MESKKIPYGYGIGRVNLTKMSCTYVQEADCEEDDRDDKMQVLTLETEDGGGGPFIRMSIGRDDPMDSQYWSVSSIDDLKEIFDDFNERLGYEEKK